MVNNEIIKRAIKKAKKSLCKYKISAIGLDNKLRVIERSFNRPRFSRFGGSVHAELQIMHNPRVRFILICRVNSLGQLKPITPCKVCSKMAQKLGIKILDIRRYNG